MTVAEMSRIDRSITIDAPPERVWRALTTRQEIETWFQMRIEGEIAAGAEIWMTTTHPDYAGQRSNVRIVSMDPPRRLVWQWHPGAVDPAVDYAREPMTTITFTLEPAGTGTRLTVSETGFDAISLARRAKVFKDNTQGWTEVLVWLQRYVEGAR